VSTGVIHAVASVDGFVADAGDDVGPLFEWYFNGDAEIVDGPRPWLTRVAADGPGNPQ
jgi:hypothetical protein